MKSENIMEMTPEECSDELIMMSVKSFYRKQERKAKSQMKRCKMYMKR